MGISSRIRALEQQNFNVDTYYGTRWFVDAKRGSNNNSGRTPTAAFLTMAKAFSVLSSGDMIVFRGKVREQLTSPAGIFDVTILGGSNRARHADDHTESVSARGSAAAHWAPPASPAATTPLLKVLQQGWRFSNFLVQPHTDAAGIQIFRDGGLDSSERDGSHAWFDLMRFDGGQNHIEFHGGPAWVRIENCYFRGSTGAALKNTVGAGIGTNNQYQILDNIFIDNASHIIVPLSQATIRGNTFAAFTTDSVELVGGAGKNLITANYLSGTYSSAGGYTVANANDEWAGNWNGLAGGITVADPA